MKYPHLIPAALLMILGLVRLYYNRPQLALLCFAGTTLTLALVYRAYLAKLERRLICLEQELNILHEIVKRQDVMLAEWRKLYLDYADKTN